MKRKVTRSHAFLAILKSKICLKNILKINNEFLAKIQHYHSVRFCREKKMQVLLMLQIVFISLYCSHIYELCTVMSLIYFFYAVHRDGLILLNIIQLFVFIISKYSKHFIGIWNTYWKIRCSNYIYIFWSSHCNKGGNAPLILKKSAKCVRCFPYCKAKSAGQQTHQQ